MQPGQDLLQKGIAAFQAGEREKARALLEQYVDIEPDDEQGWYYLAAVENDPGIRKRHLERVLAINPFNAKAREVLDRIKAREESLGGGEPAPTPAAARKEKIRAIDPEAAPRPGAADPEEGFKFPLRIQGAPEYVSLKSLAKDGFSLLRSGWDVLLRRPGSYASEVDTATWWRFWLVVLTAAVISAAFSLFLSLYFVVAFGSTLFGFFSILLTPLLWIPLALFSLFVGCYASYRFALSRGWRAPFVKHAMTAGIVWAPMVVFTSALTFILSLLRFGSGVTGILMMILAAYIMSEGYERLYLLTEPRDKYAIPAITLIVMLLIVILIRAILGGVIIGGALPF